jgi:hypothetical protein
VYEILPSISFSRQGIRIMKNLVICILLTFVCSGFVFGQPAKSKPGEPPKFDAEIALAKLALEAHGGEKLRTMKTLIMRGSVDVVTSAFNQKIPATFIVIFAKEKYRFEIANPFQPIKQVYDGVNTSTTIRGGMTLPPITRLGFPLLPMVGQAGFVITPLPEAKRKKKGFRMTSPEGYFTDFYLDEKTNQIKGYDSSYDINGRQVTTSVEIDGLRIVDGISVPEKYVQRFDTEQITIYADFKTKDILVNTEVADDVFTLGN